MKKNALLGLTMSTMLLAVIATVAVPAFARHPVGLNEFDPSTLPEVGTEYVLTISGKAQLASLAGGFDKHWFAPLNPGKLRSIPYNAGISQAGVSNPPQAVLFNSKVGLRHFQTTPDEVPISGQVTIKVASFYVSAGQSSSNAHPQSILANPEAVLFVVDSGTIKMGAKTYTIDSGSALYYKGFRVTISGDDIVLNARGAIAMPGTQRDISPLSLQSGIFFPLDDGKESSMNPINVRIKVGGDNWVVKGDGADITMSK